MCGIVGAVAERPVNKILVEGLKRLEYRGYDSAGVLAARNDGRQILVKESGKTTVLREAVGEKINDNEFTLGIAHTRWATHGKVSKENAHPHCAGEISLVHNGIIRKFIIFSCNNKFFEIFIILHQIKQWLKVRL